MHERFVILRNKNKEPLWVISQSRAIEIRDIIPIHCQYRLVSVRFVDPHPFISGPNPR
jgi:hypothetical protein